MCVRERDKENGRGRGKEGEVGEERWLRRRVESLSNISLHL